MADVRLIGLSKRFRDGTDALLDLNLDIADGEFLVLVGPSGCGKTTALRMIAGLADITAGEIRIGGRLVNDVPPSKRDIAMVFQNYALYPHMTVRKNLEIGLKLRGVSKPERETKVRETARVLGIEEYLERRPAKLSGGQRQRVAMGRAIVRDPAVFLLDEPLSNLDAKLRAEVRAEIKQLQARLNTTTIFVTHDQVEAMTMAHRIAILRHGRLQQVGTPSQLYTTPSNLFVAGFIGSPAMNFLQGQFGRDPAGTTGLRYTLDRPVWHLAVPPGQIESLSGLIGEQAIVGVRPEDMSIAPGPPDDPSWLAGKVAFVELLGSDTLVYVDVDVPPVVTEQVAEALTADDGATVPAVSSQHSARFCVRVPALVDFQPRALVHLAPTRGSLHFFGPKTGELVATVQHGDAAREPAQAGHPPNPMAGGIRQ